MDVEVAVGLLLAKVVVLTEVEVEVTVVLTAFGVRVFTGVVVYFSTAVRERVVERVVVGIVPTEVVASLTTHTSRVVVMALEAMAGVVKTEKAPRARMKSLGIASPMMRKSWKGIWRIAVEMREGRGSGRYERNREIRNED